MEVNEKKERVVLITGTSSGIGLAAAKAFLKEGCRVIGLDKEDEAFASPRYEHHVCDVGIAESLPDIGCEPDIVINNAATADERYAIRTNLEGYINVAEKYAFQPSIQCVLNVGSISGRDGLDRARYSASQGGRIAYSKNLAIRLGKRYGARVNCVSFGAVLTGLEPNLYADPELVRAVAAENILGKWIAPEEAARWLVFIALVDRSCTGQDILIDNGEEANYNWVESEPKLDD